MAFRLVLVFVGLFACCASVVASSGVALRFADSATGAAVRPSGIWLSDSSGRTSKIADVLGCDRERLALPEGSYLFTVHATGYESMSATIWSGANTPDVTLYLDPVVPPIEFSPTFVSARRLPDSTVVSAFVVDESTGEPVHGATVRTVDGAVLTTSNDRGHFLIHLPVMGDERRSDGELIIEGSGYVTHRRKGIAVWPNGDAMFSVRLRRGEGTEVFDERTQRRADLPAQEQSCASCDQPVSTAGAASNRIGLVGNPQAMPASIRVGRNCSSGTNCQSVEVYSIPTYCKRVLVAEWFSCWGSITIGGVAVGMNSLRAGSVAVRAYGVWHVYNPKTTAFDICDTTSCQVFGSTQTTNGNNAVDQTGRFVVVEANGAIIRAEYSAENNNAGCGDGYSGTNIPTAPCIQDMICAGRTLFGHGRGMCQYGSVRWATGTRVNTSSCNAGSSYGQPQDWTWIVTHYYPVYSLAEAATAAATSITFSPNPIGQGATAGVSCSITASSPVALIVRIGIAPAGTTAWVYDPSRDVKANLVAGVTVVNRGFPMAAFGPGQYDARCELWFDRNANNTVDASDFLVWSGTFPTAVTVANTANLTITPTRLDFGETPLGTTATRAFTLTNEVTSTRVISGSVGLSLTPFSVEGGGPFSLAPGSQKTVTMRFSPSALGAYSGELAVTHNALNVPSPVTVSFAGVGVPATTTVTATFGPSCPLTDRPFSLAVINGPTVTGAIDGSGVLRAEVPFMGTGDICLRVDGTLSVRVNAIAFDGSVDLGSMSVITGDADSDDRITDADLTAVILDFGAAASGANGYTDTDCSGVVGDEDVTAIILAYGLEGACP